MPGRTGSTRSRPRIGFSPESELEGGSTRVGRLLSAPGFVGVTDGLRSCRSSTPVFTGFRSAASPRSIVSRGMRAGRVTAPVGRESASPAVEFSTAGAAGRASRPFSTRDRLSSSSSGAPGVRVAAPVAVDAGGTPPIRDGRATLSVLVAESTGAGLAGKLRNGSAPSARRANASSALAGRKFSLPICLALAVVTARNCTGFTRRRFASSSERKAVKRPG